MVLVFGKGNIDMAMLVINIRLLIFKSYKEEVGWGTG